MNKDNILKDNYCNQCRIDPVKDGIFNGVNSLRFLDGLKLIYFKGTCVFAQLRKYAIRGLIQGRWHKAIDNGQLTMDN
ncbi:hypothetical protein J7L48_06520 [bacterium]|nr:hypothetical protein [bacterium]